MKVSTLKKNKDNPRQIKGEKLELLKKSVGSFQKMMPLRPIVVDENNEGLHELIELSTAAMPITNGLIVAFQSPRTFPVLLDAVRANGYHFERMLWLYKAAQCTFPWRGWILKSESILIASKGEAQWQDVHPFSHDCYYLSEVSGELAPDSGWHGSVKPIVVVRDLLARTSTVGASVYEPFAGSGTTLVACQNLNRKCYAIEISENYCAVILERMQTAFPDLEIKRLESDEKTTTSATA
jgi:hypothetical protein